VRSSEDRKWDAAAGKFVVETKGLNSTDIKKIRHVAYEQMGLLYLESERIVNLPQYNNIERKLADFGAP
jgi:3'-phosphoadenosine 5'-phosphosulfate (PAPS) 3'-phosphatase